METKTITFGKDGNDNDVYVYDATGKVYYAKGYYVEQGVYYSDVLIKEESIIGVKKKYDEDSNRVELIIALEEEVDEVKVGTASAVKTGDKKYNYVVTRNDVYTITAEKDSKVIATKSVTVSEIKEEEYTITYHFEGVAESQTQKKKASETIRLTPSEKVVREGYVLEGFSKNSLATTVDYKVGEVYTENSDLILYAVWREGEAAEYTITFDANIGTNAPSPIIKTEGEPVMLPTEIPTRNGYTFDGWSLSSTSARGEYPAGSEFTKEGDTVLFAIWIEGETNVQIEVSPSGSGKVIKSGTETKGSTMYVTAIPNPGYEFSKWEVKEGSAKVKIQNAYAETTKFEMPEGIVSLIAKFKNTEYDYVINYNANRGTNAPDPQYKKHNETIKISEEIPTRTSYTFAGWTDTLSNETVKYLPGDDYTENKDANLYAVWIKACKVTFDANGGTVSETNRIIDFGEAYGELPIPEREGYEFQGWYTEREEGEKIESTTIVANVAAQVLYAHWKEILPEAYAVYSEDDFSLRFYKTKDKIKVGEKYRGYTVTELYTGIEDTPYASNSDIPWNKKMSKIKIVEVKDVLSPISTSYWFNYALNVTDMNLTNLDTSKTENMSYMFNYCGSVENIIGLSDFNTTNVTNMSYMFASCGKLLNLDLKNFETSKVTNMSRMFDSCYKLTTLDVKHFDTRLVQDIGYMFSNCDGLTTLDLTGWDTSNVTRMYGLFDGMNYLKSIEGINKWNTSKVTFMNTVFNDCISLETLDISSWDTSSVQHMGYIFNDCRELEKITIGEKFEWLATDGYLPKPSSTYIPGANGKWYDEATKEGFAPANVPSNKAATYSAIGRYTLTFNTDGGTEIPPITAKYGSTITAPAEPTKAGYTFAGWDKEIPTSMPGKDTTITAKWEAIVYTITYTLNGGVTDNPETYTVNNNDILLKAPTKVGYTFLGWTGSNGNTPQTNVIIPTGSTGNKEYTANWTVISYTITYNLDGGTVTGNPNSYTIESEEITLINPTKEKYIFAGWTIEDGTELYETITIPTGSTGDKIYTANWKTDIIYSIPNAPLLDTGMKAVYWTDDNGNGETTSNTYPEGSYNYAMGDGETDTKDSKWANAITVEDGSYWVWIPRYAYKITYYEDESKTTVCGETTSTATISGDKSLYGDIDILFMYGTSNTHYRDINGNAVELPEGYKVHPSFQKMTTEADLETNPLGKWDEELTGIWVAKYEASQEVSEDNGATWLASTVANGGGNNLTVAGARRIVSKPSRISWRAITESNIYENTLNMHKVLNSHEMKNSEWGAVTYLTHSGYGRNGNEVSMNQCGSYYTGAGPGTGASTIYNSSYNYDTSTFDTTYAWNTEQGKLASTTGNIYGVYDMSGGAWEQMAAYINNGGVNITNNYSGGSLGTSKDMKTKQIYSSQSSSGTSTATIDYALAANVYGDAIYETSTGSSGSTSWNNDYSVFPYTSDTFFMRGGVNFYTKNVGMFAFENTGGSNTTSDGFRPVLCVGTAYTVTYNANGGIIEGTTDETTTRKVLEGETYGSASGGLPEAARKGYKFLGWYTEITGGTEITTNTVATSIADGQILYAHWEAEEATVTFDANGGSFDTGTSNTIKYTFENIVGTKISKTSNVSNDGLTADIINGYGNSQSITDVVTIPGAKLLEVTITYQTQSTSYDWVSVYDKNVTPSSSNYSSSKSGKLGGTTKTTKTFIIEGDTVQFYFKSNASTCNYYGYYAKVRTITTVLVLDGEYKEPTRDGYEFMGWSKTSDATKVEYQPGINNIPDESGTVYAIWAITVAFDANGGTITGLGSAQTTRILIPGSKYEDASAGFPATTRTGYTFLGWFTENDEQITASTIVDESLNGKTLTAKWQATSYTISYTLNGGTINGTNPTTYTIESDDITLINPTKEGYGFAGWTGTGVSTAQTTVIIPKGSTGNKTYTANWRAERELIASIANEPVLGTGMKAVYWTDDNGNGETISTTYPEGTYNYTQGNGITDTRETKWANAITESDGSYWVWIPRYAYKITSKTTYGDIEVLFLYETSDTQYRDENGNAVDLPEGYIVHPAFQKMTTEADLATNPLGKWNEELEGIWVAKYEASMEKLSGSTWTNTNTSSDSIGNVATSSSIRMVSKPSVINWGNITQSNIYTNSKNMHTALNSHQMKNSEWGAVAYLTQSAYGRNGQEIAVNQCRDTSSTYGSYTGGGPGIGSSTVYNSTYVYDSSTFTSTYAWNTTQGKLASTTGNIYGVYDMSGGTSEYVAAYVNTINSDNLTKYGANMVNATDLKTKQIYAVGRRMETQQNNYTANSSVYGDAVYETSTSYSTTNSWNGDNAYFPASSVPFFLRGGGCNYAGSAGVFSFGNNCGDDNSNFGFRPVLCVEKKETYEVTFNANGGTIDDLGSTETTRTVTEDSIYGEAEGGLPEAARSGYNFIGWFTEIDGGTQITEDTVVDSTAAGLILYAHWEIAQIASIPNAPLLGTGMKAVYWTDDNGNGETTSNTYPEGSYNYAMGDGETDTKDSKWANAITVEDGSYWVWIPRYAYQITYYEDEAKTIKCGTTTSTATIDGNKSLYGDIDILFMYGTSNTHYRDINGNEVALPEGYKVHPAFQEMTTTQDLATNPLGKWNEELQGIWIAKYEASQEVTEDGGTSWKASNASYGGGEYLTTSTTRIVSKPSRLTWRSIKQSYIYQNSLNMHKALNSHEMKNSEWGAVAYLTHSSYGRNGNEVAVNECTGYYTGAGAGTNNSTYAYDAGTFNTTYAWNTAQGKLASTTGNIYGVYDMSGGALEYTASYLNNGAIYITGEAYGGVLGTITDMKTKQVYASTVTNGTAAQSADYALAANVYGDALYETSTNYIEGASWNSDFSNMPYSSTPFFARGGRNNSNINAGIFSFGTRDGSGGSAGGFRPILCVGTKHTVTFDANGGTIEELGSSYTTRSVTEGTTYGAVEAGFPSSVRNGYNFLGWFTQPEGGTQITSGTVADSTAAGLTLYAHWEAAIVETVLYENGTYHSSIGGFSATTAYSYDGGSVSAGYDSTTKSYIYLRTNTSAEGEGACMPIYSTKAIDVTNIDYIKITTQTLGNRGDTNWAWMSGTPAFGLTSSKTALKPDVKSVRLDYLGTSASSFYGGWANLSMTSGTLSTVTNTGSQTTYTLDTSTLTGTYYLQITLCSADGWDGQLNVYKIVAYDE